MGGVTSGTLPASCNLRNLAMTSRRFFKQLATASARQRALVDERPSRVSPFAN